MLIYIQPLNATLISGFNKWKNHFEKQLEVEEDLTAVKQTSKSRNIEEVESVNISHTFYQHFGIQPGSFVHIASWSEGKELKELRTSLETIDKTFCKLIDHIERDYKEIC